MDGDTGPVEVHLPDGGRVTITGDIEAVIEAVVHASGSPADVEEAIREEAEYKGLRCTATGARGRTIVEVGGR